MPGLEIDAMSHSYRTLSPVLYLPHGGGPLPLLGDPRHEKLAIFLEEIHGRLGEPSAILVISAHWEEAQPTITSGASPSLIYDYYGFPAEAYRVKYPAPGEPRLANHARELMKIAGIRARLDESRGFDHGLFVPLKIMYPSANIPCIQLSLLKNLSPGEHIALGKSLAALRQENVLVVGSGMSFHNMKGFLAPGNGGDAEDVEFDRWLVETCTSENLGPEIREGRLAEWASAPWARFCHPREEHLLPLHVCYGVACKETPSAEMVFNDEVLGRRVSAFLWK